MIKTKLAGIEIGADFTFFAVVAMFLTLDTTGFAVMSLVVCLIHETGHLAAMLLTGQKPSSVTLRAGGVRISQLSTDNCQLSIVLAGSALNIALFFALYFTVPKTDIYPVMFAVMNLVIGLFNLLPLGCLDGKRLLAMFVPDKALQVIQAVTAVLVVIALAAAISRGGMNFTLAAAVIYIIAVDIFSVM
jgi:Zn-dependent protease